MFSKLGKTSMSVLTNATFAIAVASWTYAYLWHPKKTLGVQSFTNSTGMVMTTILVGTFKMGLIEDSAQMPVAGRNFNVFGLHDRHGNVWDMCVDIWQRNYDGAPTDGSTWPQGGDNSDKVLCGGCYFSLLKETASVFRINFVPAKPFESIGIRIVCSCNDQSFTYANQKEQNGFWT